jgi:hypothetical protein
MATLILLFRIAGAGLLLLALLHIQIGKQLSWKEDAKQLTPMNAAVFHVHTFFICVVLVMMGLPCLLDPGVFLEKSRTGAWLTWSISGFWTLRLYFQWFVYQADLWRGKRMETAVHFWFTLVWTGLATLFGVCGLWQVGWLTNF